MLENMQRIGCARIEHAIAGMTKAPDEGTLSDVLDAIRLAVCEGCCLLVPVKQTEQGGGEAAVEGSDKPAGTPRFAMQKLRLKDGRQALVAFTSRAEAEKGSYSPVALTKLDSFLTAILHMDDIAGILIDPWGDLFFMLDKDLIALIRGNGRVQSHIFLRQGDITSSDCACIVNAANRTLLGGGGVDGAIHRAAGPGLLAECRTFGGCRTGEAKLTGGYNLKAQYVIHTVGPVYTAGEKDRALLEACYWNALELAKEHEIHSIAFPAISTGVYGYPLAEAVPIAVVTVSRWLDANRNYGMGVVLYCFDRQTYELYEKFIASCQTDRGG